MNGQMKGGGMDIGFEGTESDHLLWCLICKYVLACVRFLSTKKFECNLQVEDSPSYWQLCWSNY